MDAMFKLSCWCGVVGGGGELQLIGYYCLRLDRVANIIYTVAKLWNIRTS